jgi:hypothetical protein
LRSAFSSLKWISSDRRHSPSLLDRFARGTEEAAVAAAAFGHRSEYPEAGQKPSSRIESSHTYSLQFGFTRLEGAAFCRVHSSAAGTAGQVGKMGRARRRGREIRAFAAGPSVWRFACRYNLYLLLPAAARMPNWGCTMASAFGAASTCIAQGIGPRRYGAESLHRWVAARCCAATIVVSVAGMRNTSKPLTSGRSIVGRGGVGDSNWAAEVDIVASNHGTEVARPPIDANAAVPIAANPLRSARHVRRADPLVSVEWPVTAKAVFGIPAADTPIKLSARGDVTGQMFQSVQALDAGTPPPLAWVQLLVGSNGEDWLDVALSECCLAGWHSCGSIAPGSAGPRRPPSNVATGHQVAFDNCQVRGGV